MWVCQNKTETVSVMIARENEVVNEKEGVLWWLGCKCCGGKCNDVLASGRGLHKLPVRCCDLISCSCYNGKDCERRRLFDIKSGCI